MSQQLSGSIKFKIWQRLLNQFVILTIRKQTVTAQRRPDGLDIDRLAKVAISDKSLSHVMAVRRFTQLTIGKEVVRTVQLSHLKTIGRIKYDS